MTSVGTAPSGSEHPLTSLDIGIAAEPFLNEALDEDKLESGGVGDFKFRSFVANQHSDSAKFHLREPQ